ncbi:MAG: hypothetical protein PHI11_05640 [Gallionella sp.]|nr:hypothetical protein [Gallionella sp.]
MSQEDKIEITQRLLNLQSAVRDNEIHFRPEDGELLREIMGISLKFGELLNEELLSAKALDLVRLSGMALHIVRMDQDDKPISEIGLADAQIKLFHLFEEVFIALVGRSYDTVYSHQDLKDCAMAHARTRNCERTFNAALENLKNFYSEHSVKLFTHAKNLGGLKVVLGGQRIFRDSALAGVQKMGLYVDTQLIPDPIYPFFETELQLKSKHVDLMLNLHTILQLKPLIDAHLPVPPVIVFPSFEKNLEEKDVKTQIGISELVLQVVGSACPSTFSTLEELLEYTHKRSDEFINAILAKNLFIPPGAKSSQIFSPKQAISLHLNELRSYRSPENIAALEKLPPASIIFTGVVERLIPQYHLLENADELSAQPMLTKPVHWHYFEKCAQSAAQALSRKGLLSEEGLLTVRALQNEKLEWLGNIPIPTLAILLQNQENSLFREELRKHTAMLSSSSAVDLDRVVREVTHGIENLVQKHQKTIKDIEAKYFSKNSVVVGTGILSTSLGFAAQFIPALGILGSASPVVAAGATVVTYTNNKLQEKEEKSLARRSLLGVLATTSRD